MLLQVKVFGVDYFLYEKCVGLIRRNICDMDSRNISKLFPTILRHVLDKCNGDFTDIISVLNQEMVGNNASTSGSYMPTDAQMHDVLFNANVYGCDNIGSSLLYSCYCKHCLWCGL